MEPFSPLEPKAAAKTGLSLPEKKFRVLVGVTGSVAALKLPLLISELLKIPGVEVKVVTTERAKHFYNPQEIPVPLYSDEDEWQHRCERELISPLAVLLQMHSHASVAFMWRGAMARKLSGWSRRSAEVCWVPGCCSSRQSCSGGALCVAVEVQLWKGRSDPVLHIELRRWADLMLVAPLDANTLAKLATGICDNLLTCVIRAWDLRKPLLFCPAMNTAMWEHPITAQQVEQLKGFGYTEIPCVVKKLVCGDEGRGAMAEVWTIAESVRRVVAERDLPAQS
uniref:Phosphopantothenoylcysteine decarboxylase n=1 Tax=Cairina moschata TaxID=8855 RepID=A0A8C3CIK0_CAIMO